MSNLAPRPLTPKLNKPNFQMAVKAATPDIVLVDQATLPPEAIQIIAFDSLSAVELIEIARHDMVNGQVINYNIIKDVADVEVRNNSRNILALPESSDSVFSSYPINFGIHVPNQIDKNAVYFDEQGNLIIEIFNPKQSLDVEVQILNSGSVLNDTIYSG